MKKAKPKKKVRHHVIAEYATTDDDGDWFWLPSTFEKYTVRQIERLRKRYRHQANITIGMNAIADLYKRVAKLEKKK